MVLSYMFGISRRYEMIIMIVTAATISYTYRVNISVAIPDMKEQFNWSEQQRGYILSSFFWGYASGQVPFSKLAQYIGAKPIVMMSIFLPGAIGFLFPYIAKKSFPAALVARVLIGLFSSGLYPSIYHLFPHWIPSDESTVLVPLATCGNYFGEIIGFAISGWLIGFCNWAVLFYVFGLVGVLWCPLWYYIAAESPQVHPSISPEELSLFDKNRETLLNKQRAFQDENMITQRLLGSKKGQSDMKDHSYRTIVTTDDSSTDDTSNSPLYPGMRGKNEDVSDEGDADSDDDSKRTPWLAFFTTPSSLTLLLGSWTNGWTGFLMLSELPSYLTDVLGFTTSMAGLMTVAPYIALLISNFAFSECFRRLESRWQWSTRSIRQVAQLISFMGSSVFLLGCAFTQNQAAALVLMILSQACLGANNSGLGCAYLDLAPRFSGNFNSCGNCIAAVAGIAGPLVVSSLISNYGTDEGWKLSFYLTTVMSTVASLAWIVFQKSEINIVLNSPTSRKFK